MFCTGQTASRGASWHYRTGTIAALMVLFGTVQAEAQIKPAQLHQKKTITIPSSTQFNRLPFGFEVTTLGASKIQGRLSSSGVNWVCKGSVCSTNVKYPGFGVTACNKLALVIGPVRSFRLTRQPAALKPVKGYPFNAKQIARCNQGVNGLKSAKINTRLSVPVVRNSSTQKTGAVLGTSPVGQAANRAGKIGKVGNRMKQAKELQRLNESGSVVDQAMGGGASERQDCTRSANRAKCLRDNLNADNTPSLLAGGGMSDCLLAGGDLSSCFSRGQRGGGSGAGRMTSGPGGAADGVNIPGRGQAQSGGGKGNGSHWGQWRANTNPEPAGEHSMYRQSENDDGSESLETVTTNSRTGATTRQIFTYTSGQDGGISQSTTTNRDGQVMSVITQQSYADGSNRIETKRYNADGDVTSTTTTVIPADAGGQAAPDRASSGPADNCNWNPALGKCMAHTPDPRGMTTRPGPDGEDTGGILGRNAPHTDVGAAINCGDASSDACKRAASGLDNRAKPLDMKDPGPTPGGSPH